MSIATSNFLALIYLHCYSFQNSDLPNTSILYTLFLRHGIYPYRHARAILMCLTLLNSFNHMKSFTMIICSWLKFVKKRGTSIYLWGYMSCLLLCVLIAHSRFGTVCNYLYFTRITELLGLTVPISLDDSTTAGGAWHFCVGRLLLLLAKVARWHSLSFRPLWSGSATSGICA